MRHDDFNITFARIFSEEDTLNVKWFAAYYTLTAWYGGESMVVLLTCQRTRVAPNSNYNDGDDLFPVRECIFRGLTHSEAVRRAVAMTDALAEETRAKLQYDADAYERVRMIEKGDG